jgi:hypothetical protein
MKKMCSPQEKKALSYKKDRRNTYGERGGHARHDIAAHKARDRRVYRRQANQILNGNEIHQTELREELELEVKSVAQSSWRKSPDKPLGQAVKWKLERRVRRGINLSIKKLLGTE